MIVDVGNNAHSVSDHTQGNWNGIAGRIELQATDPVWIDDVRVYPNIKDKTVKVNVSIGNSTGAAGAGTLAIHVAQPPSAEVNQPRWRCTCSGIVDGARRRVPRAFARWATTASSGTSSGPISIR